MARAAQSLDTAAPGASATPSAGGARRGKIEIRRFIPDDLAQLRARGGKLPDLPGLADELAQAESWSGVVGGQVLAAAGLIRVWEGRATAWACFTCDIPGAAWPRMILFARQVLRQAPYRRIEAQVHAGFYPGHRLMRLLGFQIEGPAWAFNPDGSDAYHFARIAAAGRQ